MTEHTVRTLIAFAGLPATGKTTLAQRLRAALDGVLLSKDELRAAVFPPHLVEYSRAQDDLCMEMAYSAATYLLRRHQGTPVILDGRTFTRRAQVERLVEVARDAGATLCVIACVCDDQVAERRLAGAEADRHPAGNRDFDLYRSLRADAEPLDVPHLTVETGIAPVDEAVRACAAYVAGGASR